MRWPAQRFAWRLRGFVGSAAAAALALALAGSLAACVVTADSSIEADPADPRAQDIADRIRGLDLGPRQTRSPGSAAPREQNPQRGAAVYLGDGAPPRGGALAPDGDGSASGYDLAFDNAPVATVAKVILGDILGTGYTIDPRVQGTVTLASVRPIAKTDALAVLENALRTAGVALLRERGGYRLAPLSDSVGVGGIDRAGIAEPGQGLSVVPLRHVSAQTVFKLLDAFGARAATLRVDTSRNMVLVQGAAPDRAAVIDTILSFDADWMRGQSVGVYPVRNSAPEPIIAEIEKIMDNGDGGLGQGVVKLSPIARLNAILAVSARPEHLKRAGTWIARLDRSDTQGVNLKVYPLRYGSARAMTTLLNDMLTGAGPAPLDGAASQIAPGAGVSVTTSGGPVAALSALPPTATAIATAPARPAEATPPIAPQRGTAGGGASLLANVRITADVTNNAILVYANAEAQRIVEQTIRQIDRPQRQIAIEATIAEVTLNDTLNYGVQVFLASKDVGLKPDTGSLLNTVGNAVINRALPGFNFLIGPEAAPRLILDALHGVTDVKVLSNPSLVVLDNQPATLQVGDQVPVSTGTATVLTANNTIVNTIDYRNTGIILRVLPRANASGNVVLDIEQEISNIAAGSAQSLTPTVSQRRVKSSVAVASGQTVLLAGLISETENRVRQGIPLLDALPGVGDAFAHQNKMRTRTELILFIRPTVVRDPIDASVIAEEMRAKINGRIVGSSEPVTVLPRRR